MQVIFILSFWRNNNYYYIYREIEKRERERENKRVVEDEGEENIQAKGQCAFSLDDGGMLLTGGLLLINASKAPFSGGHAWHLNH